MSCPRMCIRCYNAKTHNSANLAAAAAATTSTAGIGAAHNSVARAFLRNVLPLTGIGLRVVQRIAALVAAKYQHVRRRELESCQEGQERKEGEEGG
jgi:hypothetical protein